MPNPNIIKPKNTALLPPSLSAKYPNNGANIPQNNICIPIASPNSVLVHPIPSSKALKNKPNVCLKPIEIKIMEHAENRTIRANLLGINFIIILHSVMIFSNPQLNLSGLQVQYGVSQYVHLFQNENIFLFLYILYHL